MNQLLIIVSVSVIVFVTTVAGCALSDYLDRRRTAERLAEGNRQAIAQFDRAVADWDSAAANWRGYDD